MTKTLHLTIEGRVQGVGYRQWFARQAVQFGLKGWVRNRQDGSVEAVISGLTTSVDTLIELARKGPRLAAVSRILLKDGKDEGWSGFAIRATE